MKKSLWIFCAVLCIGMVLLSSCNAASKREGSYYPNAVTNDMANGADGYYDETVKTSMEMAEDGSGGTQTAAPSDFPKKLIKTGDVVIEAKDVTAVYQEILKFVKEKGGYEFSQSTTKNEYSNTITATIKIPPQHLEALLTFSGTQGELLRSETNSNDITDSYYDSKLRLESLKSQLEKYREFLKDTKNIDDMLRVQREIDRLVSEIESMEGRLKKWDSQVDESTVHFTITQKADPSLKRREIHWNALSFGDMGYLIKSGFVSVVNVVVSVLQWAAIVLLVVSPLWIPAVIAVFLILRKKKAAKKRRSEIIDKE